MEVNQILKFWRFCLTLGLGLILVLGLANPSLASIHTYPESPGQTMYRSVQSFRDDANRAWQVVLYKRVKAGLVDSIHLRLVGFPGIVEVAHPEPIEITSGTGKSWQAEDVFEASLLPTNVGEYDLLEFMKQLDANPPLRLKLPLKDEKIALLTIPPFAVEEWRKLVMNYPTLKRDGVSNLIKNCI